jgi:hypothetical protein
MATSPSHPAANYVTRRRRASLAQESTAVLAGRMELVAERLHMVLIFGTCRAPRKRRPPTPKLGSP